MLLSGFLPLSEENAMVRGILLITCAILLTFNVQTRALEPADPDLMPEARAVLDYLESAYGERTLTGISGTKNAAQVHELTGKYPAIVAVDISGWNSPTWGESYTRVVERYIEQVREWWEAGGIPSMQFHWKHPMKPNGTAWVGKHGKNPPSGEFDIRSTPCLSFLRRASVFVSPGSTCTDGKSSTDRANSGTGIGSTRWRNLRGIG
ncbi:MAG: glycosyl hydrolase, partial [Pirellulaceae bacterium]